MCDGIMLGIEFRVQMKGGIHARGLRIGIQGDRSVCVYFQRIAQEVCIFLLFLVAGNIGTAHQQAAAHAGKFL